MSGTIDDPENVPTEPTEPSGPTDGVSRDATAGDQDQSQDLGDQRNLMDQSQTDAAWQEIVAELSDLSTDPGPELTTDPGPAEQAFDFPVAPWVSGAGAAEAAGPRDWQRSADAEQLAEAEGEFVPPDPAFELSPDRLRNLGWFLVAGAPVVAVLALLLWSAAPALLYTGLVVAFLAGAALLMWRLPHDRDDEPHDGGAVV